MSKEDGIYIANIIVAAITGFLGVIGAVTAKKREQAAIDKSVQKFLEGSK